MMMTPAECERFIYEHRHQIRLAVLIANFVALAALLRLAWRVLA